jgi:hypothetical protein
LWAPNCTRLSAHAISQGPTKLSISIRPHQNPYARGRINHRSINSYIICKKDSHLPDCLAHILRHQHQVLKTKVITDQFNMIGVQCCYITVDSAAAVSQNRAWTTQCTNQQMCDIIILLHSYTPC